MRRLRHWVGQLLDPPARAARPSAAPRGAADASEPSPRLDLIRETLAAVIYEAFFPTRSWGDATRSGKQTAYASADAVMHALNLPKPNAGPRPARAGELSF